MPGHAGPNALSALSVGPVTWPAGPDALLPGPVVLQVPMLKLLTGPIALPLVPVPLPLDVVAVEWRVIVVADSCIGPPPSGAAVGVGKAFPGAFGPWCVFASAVPAAARPIHIVAAVIAPVITMVRVHDPCWVLCLPAMSPLCN